MSGERERLFMRSCELEADNIVLIDIVDRDIQVMHSLVKTLKSLLTTSGHLKSVIIENIADAENKISASRDFLEKLYAEGKYPPL